MYLQEKKLQDEIPPDREDWISLPAVVRHSNQRDWPDFLKLQGLQPCGNPYRLSFLDEIFWRHLCVILKFSSIPNFNNLGSFSSPPFKLQTTTCFNRSCSVRLFPLVKSDICQYTKIHSRLGFSVLICMIQIVLHRVVRESTPVSQGFHRQHRKVSCKF